MMTVKGLVELLSKFPDDYKIVGDNGEVWIDCNNHKEEIRVHEGEPIGLKDKEYVVYMIGSSAKAMPDGVRYRNRLDAYAAAERFSEHDSCPYYVHEVVMVCNTIAQFRCYEK